MSRYGEPVLNVWSHGVFLCEKESLPSEIRQGMTMQPNERVNNCARLLSDGRLLEKLSGDVSPHMFDWPLHQREGLSDIH